MRDVTATFPITPDDVRAKIDGCRTPDEFRRLRCASLWPGLGVQGHKRRRFAGADYVAIGRSGQSGSGLSGASPDVPLQHYDAVLACIPDAAEARIAVATVSTTANTCWSRSRSGPIVTSRHHRTCSGRREQTGVVIYTAYNHRFEPHFVRMRDLIASGELGEIYSCRMFYGNGTARLVRDSAWRDQGAGVLPDLGSHLLDTCRFWFGDIDRRFAVSSAANRFENVAPDHVVIAQRGSRPPHRTGDDAADVAQPFHLRRSCRERARRISRRSANGGRRPSPSGRACCRAAGRPRRR